jgi:hypothetical protein
MMRFLLPFVLLAFATVSISAFAQDASDSYKADYDCAKQLQIALKNNDKKAVARLFSYPVKQEYPLPPIKSADDFIAHWDEFFDAENIKWIIEDTPDQIGWRGVQLVNGSLWFNDGKIFAFHFRTDLFQKNFTRAKSDEEASINAEAHGYNRVLVRCEAQTKFIRIQEHDDGAHYFVWKKGESLSKKPELNLVGTQVFDGSGGNSHYTFENHGYSYVLDDPVLCEDVCHKTLTVSKDGKEITNQVCRDK